MGVGEMGKGGGSNPPVTKWIEPGNVMYSTQGMTIVNNIRLQSWKLLWVNLKSS